MWGPNQDTTGIQTHGSNWNGTTDERAKLLSLPPNIIPEFIQFVAAESKLRKRSSKDKPSRFVSSDELVKLSEACNLMNTALSPRPLIRIQLAGFPPTFHQRAAAESFQWHLVSSAISTAFPCLFPGWMLMSEPSGADVMQFSLSELGGAPCRPTASVHIWFFSSTALVLDTELTSSHAKCITWRQFWGQLVPETFLYLEPVALVSVHSGSHLQAGFPPLALLLYFDFIQLQIFGPANSG